MVLPPVAARRNTDHVTFEKNPYYIPNLNDDDNQTIINARKERRTMFFRDGPQPGQYYFSYFGPNNTGVYFSCNLPLVNLRLSEEETLNPKSFLEQRSLSNVDYELIFPFEFLLNPIIKNNACRSISFDIPTGFEKKIQEGNKKITIQRADDSEDKNAFYSFLMGTHPRLGAESLVLMFYLSLLILTSRLPKDVIRIIGKYSKCTG